MSPRDGSQDTRTCQKNDFKIIATLNGGYHTSWDSAPLFAQTASNCILRNVLFSLVTIRRVLPYQDTRDESECDFCEQVV